MQPELEPNRDPEIATAAADRPEQVGVNGPHVVQRVADELLGSRTMFVDAIDHGVAATIMAFLDSSDASMRVAQLRVLGGAMARVPVDATAFAHRTSPIMVSLAAFYEGPQDKLVREAWIAEFAAAMHQGDDRAYVNFLGDEGEARIWAAYPGATWERLTEIKGQYDPTNLFRLNQNVPPN